MKDPLKKQRIADLKAARIKEKENLKIVADMERTKKRLSKPMSRAEELKRN